MPLPESVKDILAGAFGVSHRHIWWFWSASRFFYSHRPFDIVKVRIQTAPPGYYSGVVSCISDIFKKGGFAGFYKGTELPLIGVGACVSIQFGVVQYFKRLFQDMNAKQHGKQGLHLTHSQLYLSGLAGGVTNSVLAAPIEHVRIRLQTQQTPLYSGPVDCMKQLVAKGGTTGLFRGTVPTVLREGHGMGVYFLTYEYIVQQVMHSQNVEHRSQLSPTTPLLAGASAGVVLWLMVYPIDVVKSYMQTDALVPAERQFRGMFDVVRKVNAASGPKAFFRGIAPTLLRAPFANGATFVAFELALHQLSHF